MIDPIWKNVEGKFLQVKHITDRERGLLEWAGAKEFLSEDEFKLNAIKDQVMTTPNWEKEFENQFAGATGYCNPKYAGLIKSFFTNYKKIWEDQRTREIIEQIPDGLIELPDPLYKSDDGTPTRNIQTLKQQLKDKYDINE